MQAGNLFYLYALQLESGKEAELMWIVCFDKISYEALCVWDILLFA